MSTKKDLYAVGEMPPVGHVPARMHAFTVRKGRFGQPKDSFRVEVVDTPEVGDDEVLVYVMAAGVNYNNVWAALGVPVDVIATRQKAGEKEDFHIGGSDASGIVYKVGKNVKSHKVGDEVVIHCGTWNADCPSVRAGVDPMYSPTFRIWGYETNWGSFAQFTRVQAHQCMPRPSHLSWEASASYVLVGATAYRMLCGWAPNTVRKDDVVLIWGGAGGLGSMAIQIAKAFDAIPIAVVSANDKFEFCKSLGAKGCINRNDFDHWGMLPHWKDAAGYGDWLKGVRKFGKSIWDAVGEKRSPELVFEHPGESTIPTSIFVCETGGMVTICAGTTGYNATVDLRYLWMRQKRLQGSHFANDEQSLGLNQLVVDGLVDPCLSRTFTFDELPAAHQLMYENKHPHGNMAVLVGAREMGTGGAEKPALRTHSIPAPSGPPLHLPVAALNELPLEPLTARAAVADTTPVGRIMRSSVVTCGVDATLEEVVKLLLRHKIHAVIVTNAVDSPIGVVSQTDIVLARQGRAPADALRLTAGEIMTRGCISCAPATPLHDAVTLMTKHHVHRLVVQDGEGPSAKMVGILSMTDVITKTLGFSES